MSEERLRGAFGLTLVNKAVTYRLRRDRLNACGGQASLKLGNELYFGSSCCCRYHR